MEKDVMERAKTLVSKEIELRDTLAKLGKLEVKQVVNEEKYPDHMEIDLGGTGNRGKLYFNSDNLEVSKLRLSNYFEVVKARDELLEARKVKCDA